MRKLPQVEMMENLVTKCQSCRVLPAEIIAPRREFLKYALVMRWLVLSALVRILKERDELRKALTRFNIKMKWNKVHKFRILHCWKSHLFVGPKH